MTYNIIEEEIEKNGHILTVPVGYSMWPMLINRKDQIVIVRKDRSPVIGDVVLFKRPDGKYVLHRVIEKNENGYVIMGDNCRGVDRNVKEEDIIGILSTFYKKDKKIDCESDRRYLRYVKRLPHTRRIHRFTSRIYLKLKGIKDKIEDDKD